MVMITLSVTTYLSYCCPSGITELTAHILSCKSQTLFHSTVLLLEWTARCAPSTARTKV